MRRTTLRIFVALLALTLATSCPREERPTASATASSAPVVGLDITIFSIGQADAMLVVGPEPEKRSLLIDLGTPRGEDGFTHSRVAARIKEITGRRGVDYFMVSHFHEDHVGRHSKKSPRGIFGLLSEPTDKFRIGTWFDRGDGALEYGIRTRAHRHTIEHLPRYIESGRVGRRAVPNFGTGDIDLGGGIVVDVLAVAGRVFPGDKGALAAVDSAKPGIYTRAPASENDFSIAVEISLGDFELFTAGDLNGAPFPGEGKPYATHNVRFFGKKGSTYTNVEGWMVKHWQSENRESDVEIYRANHHGSKNSSTAELVDALDPEVVIYSAGGMYGHPDPEVVRRGAEGAVQLVTDSASEKSWPEGLPSELADIVGETHIEVAADGASYLLNGKRMRSWSDEQEASGADVKPER
jgi:hypothetical protein